MKKVKLLVNVVLFFACISLFAQNQDNDSVKIDTIKNGKVINDKIVTTDLGQVPNDPDYSVGVYTSGQDAKSSSFYSVKRAPKITIVIVVEHDFEQNPDDPDYAVVLRKRVIEKVTLEPKGFDSPNEVIISKFPDGMEIWRIIDNTIVRVVTPEQSENKSIAASGIATTNGNEKPNESIVNGGVVTGPTEPDNNVDAYRGTKNPPNLVDTDQKYEQSVNDEIKQLNVELQEVKSEIERLKEENAKLRELQQKKEGEMLQELQQKKGEIGHLKKENAKLRRSVGR